MLWTNLAAGRWAYDKGLHDLGDGAYAWLQPDGGWGWSNAGLLADGDQSLLVDTLFDLPHTSDMLDAMRRSVPAAASIGQLVNTHANGDHCFGNELLEGAEIVASQVAATEMAESPPERLAAMMAMAKEGDDELSTYLRSAFGAFDFEGISLTLPTRTFEQSLSLQVGDKQVDLYEVGPAHTRGDILVHVPGDRLLYSGDILFIEGTPIVWAGPVENWIAACDRILALDVDIIVPGHGPITNRRGPEAVRAYLEYIRDEARKRYDAGLDAFEAAQDIGLGDFESWGDAERIAINVDSLYREFSGSQERTEVAELFRRMALLEKR